MIVRNEMFEDNVNGRVGCFLIDGKRTHTVTIRGRRIYIESSEGDTLEVLYDIYPGFFRDDFVVRAMDARVSGFDGKALIGLFGFDADTSNSRLVYIKGERVYG